MYATWLADVLRKAGCVVQEMPGWTTRSVPGTFKEVRGVLCHHTAGSSRNIDMSILLAGRPDLAGPLCQLGLGRDGTYYVIAAGKAYHAGKGSWKTVPTDSGNSYFIGIEAQNKGTPDDPWPEVQMDAYAKGVAAILKHCGLSVEDCIGHKEYAPKRKSDPSFDMKAFRKRVAEHMK